MTYTFIDFDKAKSKAKSKKNCVKGVVALVLVGVTAKYLVDAYAPSDTEKSMNDLKKNLEEIRKNRK